MRRAIAAYDSRDDSLEVTAPLCGTKEMPGPIVYYDSAGKIFLTSTLSALIAQTSGQTDAQTTYLLSMVQGNYYNQLGMIETGEPFDFVLPFAPHLPLDSSATHIPYGAVRTMLLTKMDGVEDYLRLMSRTPFAARTIAGGPPPPVRDDAVIKTLLNQEGITDPVSAPFVRLKLWHLQNQIFSELCRKFSLTYLAGAPADTQDEDGFLRVEYVKDAVHANGLWAELFLTDVIAMATASEEKIDA